MTPEQHTEYLRKHYVARLQQHGMDHRAVDWGSQQGQWRRFETLLEVGSYHNSSLLDVGCGLGHLVDYLQVQEFRGRYLGLDALPEMVENARLRHPSQQFEVGQLGLTQTWVADYVIGSGLFNLSAPDLMQATVKALFSACKTAVAFNCLSAWRNQPPEDGEFYADPLQTLEMCRAVTPWVTLRHDYMPHDFTVYLYRNARQGMRTPR